MPDILITNEDNMDLMARYPDKYFDLAIVDPEYGINAGLKKSYHKNALTQYKPKKWDNSIPDKTYFEELFRVSKHQIVWGGNYFSEFLPPMPKWIVWDKKQPEGIDQAMFELAWNSQVNKQSKIYRQSAQSNCNKVANNKVLAKVNMKKHPTQKPAKMYEWLLHNYAETGWKILDTHLGSGKIAHACHKMRFQLTACEIDTDYYNDAIQDLKQYQQQLTMF